MPTQVEIWSDWSQIALQRVRSALGEGSERRRAGRKSRFERLWLSDGQPPASEPRQPSAIAVAAHVRQRVVLAPESNRAGFPVLAVHSQNRSRRRHTLATVIIPNVADHFPALYRTATRALDVETPYIPPRIRQVTIFSFFLCFDFSRLVPLRLFPCLSHHRICTLCCLSLRCLITHVPQGAKKVSRRP